VKVMVKHEVRVSKSERILPLPVPVTCLLLFRGKFSQIYFMISVIVREANSDGSLAIIDEFIILLFSLGRKLC